jgi:ubiquinone biosynthesis protein COQ9
MIKSLPADPTLDEIRTVLSPALAMHAAFDGWNEAAVRAAAVDYGIDGDVAALAFKGAFD